MNARELLMLGLMATMAGLLATPSAEAQSSSAASDKSATAAAAPRDPVALAALDRMGQSLRGLQQFSLTSDTSTEVVLDNGQKIELDGTLVYKVQRPNRMYVEIKSDRKLRQLYFDAGKLTVYSPRLNYYASTDLESQTLAELAVNAATRYGIDLPLADMFFWGTEYAPKDLILSAIYVGAGLMDGQRVDQYAFRQEGVDWQLWISQETRLPKKLVITSLDDPAMPQYTAHLHWDTKTPVAASAFQFAPPEGSAQIRLVPVEVAVVEVEQEN